MDTAFNTTVIAAFTFCAAVLTAIFLWDVAIRVIHSLSPRRELRKRLGHLPMSAVLDRLGGDPRHYLRRTPAAELHERSQACATCADAAHCARLLASRCDATAFAFCPNFAALSAAAAEYECGRNPYCGAGSALPPITWSTDRRRRD